MKCKVAIVGAGKIGEMICDLLVSSNDYDVTMIDSSQEQLDGIPDVYGLVKKVAIDVTVSRLSIVLEDQYAVINACPYHLTKTIALAASTSGTNYLDLTEDVASTQYVRELAKTSKATFIPQCGLAPGFISIVTNSIAKKFDSLDEIRMRVGALPEFPTNSLTYNLTWSTDGVINEYCEPCEAVRDGKVISVPALSELEEFNLDGVQYEAFNTSGGMGSLGETLDGKVRDMSYQTIRYPGHRDIMRTLIHDLRLGDRRDLLKDILENAVPATGQDVVLIFVTVSGTKDGRLFEESYANKIYSQNINGTDRNGIQITTSAAVCAMLDLMREDKLPLGGLVLQEDISLEDFLGNRFGQYYKQVK